MQDTATHIDYKALYEAAQLQISALRFELDQLKKLIYGSRHERFIPAESNTAQLSLDMVVDATATVAVTSEKQINYTRQQVAVTAAKHPVRMKLPEHLERKEIIIEPTADLTGCKKIGEEVTEELDYEPGRLFVNRYVRPKYSKAGGEGIITAPMVERPLPKAIAGAGLLAQTIIDKYVDHLPLHRQMQRFSREGINIPYSTLTDWVNNTAKLITPLYEALRTVILQTNYLHVDETPIKVMDKDKKGSTHRGYYWVYHNSLERMVLFDYHQGRGGSIPQQMLAGFKGHLQTDGYTVYDFFKEKEGVTVLHCMAHARRMFHEAQQNDLPIAAHALEQFGILYAIERHAKDQGMNDTERLALRQEQALPVLQSLGKWMKEQYVQSLPKSTIGKALGYGIERWDYLMTYATDGKLNIDNNPVERSIRPIAIGRKNYLFAGSHEAAQRSAMLYSLLGTCKLNGINPFIWLKDVLQRLPAHPINKIQELLPQNWQPINPVAI
jgi:transposase